MNASGSVLHTLYERTEYVHDLIFEGKRSRLRPSKQADISPIVKNRAHKKVSEASKLFRVVSVIFDGLYDAQHIGQRLLLETEG